MSKGVEGNVVNEKDLLPTSKIQDKMAVLLKRVPELGEVVELQRQVGEGTFSQVYLARARVGGGLLAVKHLVPTVHPTRASTELSAMHSLGGKDNIAEVLMCLRKNDCIVFLMPYMEHDRFASYVTSMDVEETKEYLRQLLIALRRVHSFGIIHRDVKPSNFLYNRKQRRFMLVDFGLAQKVEECYLSDENRMKKIEYGKKRKREDEENEEGLAIGGGPDSKRQAIEGRKRLAEDKKIEEQRRPLGLINRATPIQQLTFQQPANPQGRRGVFAKPDLPGRRCGCEGRLKVCKTCLSQPAMAAPRAGTPGFRPPEVLLRSPHQTTAVDIWAVGVILLSIMSSTYPFFRAPDDITALAEIISIFGTRNIKHLAIKLGRNIVYSEEVCEADLKKLVNGLRKKRKFENRKKSEITEREDEEQREGGETESLDKVGEDKRKRNSGGGEECKKCGRREGWCAGAQAGGGSGGPWPGAAFALLGGLLALDPAHRLTAQQALDHPFLAT